jgi:hypothetical protein
MLVTRRLSSTIRLVIPTYRVHPLVALIGGVTLVLLIGISGAMLAGRTASSSPIDFLSPYANLFPGQSSLALENYPCGVPEYIQATLGDDRFYCEIYIADGPVRQVNVSGMGDTIDIFSMALRTSSLTSGDLTHGWGAPETVTVKRPYYTMRWQNGVSIVGQINTWSPYQSGVLFVSFNNMALPGIAGGTTR